MARLLSDGSADQSFGTGGSVQLPDATPHIAAVLQDDGRIVVATHAPTDGVIVQRLNPDGTIDTTFGNGGRLAIRVVGEYFGISDLVAMPDGRLVVAAGTNDGALFLRFGTDGTIDTTFGADGMALSPRPWRPLAIVARQDSMLVGTFAMHEGPVAIGRIAADGHGG